MKVYTKPEVRIERFNLSKHIAACTYDMSNFAKAETCTATGDLEIGMPDIPYFSTENTSCVTEPVEYCYTGATAGGNIFNS